MQTTSGGTGKHRQAGHCTQGRHAAGGEGKDAAVMAGESLGSGLEPICEGLLDGNLRFSVWRRLLHRVPAASLAGPNRRNTGKCACGFRLAGHLMRSGPPTADGCLRKLAEDPGRRFRFRSVAGRGATSRRPEFPVRRWHRTTPHSRDCRFKNSRIEVNGVQLYRWAGHSPLKWIGLSGSLKSLS